MSQPEAINEALGLAYPEARCELDFRDPFELLEEIERILGIHTAPMNWPIGSGDRFRGVFDLSFPAVD